MEGIRIVCPYASCNDCCIVHSNRAGADPELVGGGGGGWSCMLLPHTVPSCTDAGPDLCTWHPDLCTLCLQWLSLAAIYGGGASPSAIGTDSTWTRGGFTHSNLLWWCFSFHPLVQILDIHSGNLHCVVVVYIYIYEHRSPPLAGFSAPARGQWRLGKGLRRQCFFN